jgi:hypothetical protein
MKSDTQNFHKLYCSSMISFSEQCDPFLIATSRIGAYSIPISEQVIEQAKACQQMLMFEKSLPQ